MFKNNNNHRLGRTQSLFSRPSSLLETYNPLPPIEEPKQPIVLEKELSVKELIVVFEKEEKKEMDVPLVEPVETKPVQKTKLVDKLIGLSRYKKVAPK